MGIKLTTRSKRWGKPIMRMSTAGIGPQGHGRSGAGQKGLTVAKKRGRKGRRGRRHKR